MNRKKESNVKKSLTFLTLCAIVLFSYTVVESSDLTMNRRLEYFIYNNSSLTTKQSQKLATKFLKYGNENAKWLAATAKQESDFTPSAIGTSGEKSAFQILEFPRNKNPLNWDHAIEEALKVRKEKQLTHKNRFNALRAYNGSIHNPKTYRYAKNIKHYMESI